MRRDPNAPDLLRATIVGLLMLAASTGAIYLADAPLDVLAVAGGVGTATSLALLALTGLVALWRRSAENGYVATSMHDDAVAAAFDDPDVEQPLDDVAAV